MPVVRAFDRSMIEKALRSFDLKFLRDEDNDFVVRFGRGKNLSCDLVFLFSLGGKNSEIFEIQVIADYAIPRRNWGQTLLSCNKWNREKRWPKAYLSMKDAEGEGNIVLEAQIDMEKGIHQEFVDQFTGAILAAWLEFWRWAIQDEKL